MSFLRIEWVKTVLDAAIIIGVTVLTSAIVIALATFAWRKAARAKSTAIEVRNPLGHRIQQKLLDDESALANELLSGRLEPAAYRRSMYELAVAAREWPNPVVSAG